MYNRSNIMSSARAIYLKGLVSTQSEALKAAWKKAKFQVKLRAAVVEFAYANKEGELREAKGTLQADFLPEGSTGAGKYLHLVTYWDLEKDNWRSFTATKLHVA